jgi:hypothetical protein
MRAPSNPTYTNPNFPLGYQDSGADIAYALQSQSQISALTPIPSPSPADSAGWTFPDAEAGIVSALKAGATHLWANTILFSSHPLQTSPLIAKHQNAVHVIGQPQNMVEQFDDKDYVNNFLRSQKTFTLPRGWTIHNSENLSSQITELSLLYPVVAKPIRGRGSHGVKVCHSQSELLSHIWSLFAESPTIMIEEYLSGEEAAVTVMSPSSSRPNYWALPIVTRFNHQFGIAPYNGVVAVTANSRVISSEEYAADARYGVAARECEAVAKLLKVTAPIRIDIRRFSNQPDSKFALFDVNMKPVSI